MADGIHEVVNNEIGNLQDELYELTKKINTMSIREKAIRKDIAGKAEIIRLEEEAKNNFIKGLRVVSTHDYHISYRMKSTPLNSDQEEILDELYKENRVALFKKISRISGINNPMEVIESLRSSNRDPWEFLEIRVKSGKEEEIAELTPLEIAESAFVTESGFLSKIRSISTGLSEGALKYTKAIMKRAIKPVIIKGK